MSDRSPGAEAESDGAVPIFLSWLEEREEGRGPTFEELCTLHADLRPRLAALRVAHERARALLEATAGEVREAAPDAEPRLPGERYTLHGEIARGGMGVILEMYDSSLRRTIAMKVVRSQPFQSPEEHARHQSRLLAEAQVLAQLDHPGVVSIHEVGLDALGRAYFTMKRVQGHDFQVVIDAHHAGDKVWRLARAVGVLMRVCEAIAYAHSKGVIHRDLKPANVMVGRFGEVFVMDWGLAKVLGRAEAPPVPMQQSQGFTAPRGRVGEAGSCPASPAPSASALVHTDRESGSPSGAHREGDTAPGFVLGTPGYIAPEQVRGEVESSDARVDVYAIGALLYHLLAGHRPYSKDRRLNTSELLSRISAGPPEPLARVARNAPDELVAIAEKAMAREPADRYATVLELTEDLGAWLERRVVRAHRTGAWVELRKWVRRNRGAAAAILAVVLGLGATAMVESVLRRDLARAHEEGELRAEELQRESTHSRMALASAAFSNGDIGRMHELLDDCPANMRGWEWSYLSRESDTSARTLQLDGMDLKSALFFDGGRKLLTGGGEKPARILVWDLQSGQVEHEIRIPDDGSINSASLSADGTRLAVFARLGDLRLWDTRGWKPLPSLDARMHGWHGVAFAPSGQRLAAYGTEGVQLWDAERRENLANLSAGQKDIADVGWSPDGRRLCAASWDGSVSVWDTEPAGLVTVLRDSRHRMQQVEYSPDGRWIAGGDWDSRVLVWDAGTLELVQRSDRIGGHVMALAWSPDSSLLAAGGKGVVVRLFDAGTWEPVGRLVGHTAAVQTLAFAPAGRTMVSGCALGTARFWDLDRLDWRTLYCEDGREPPAGVAFSSDGLRVAVGWGDGEIEIWNTRQRVRERSLQSGARVRHLDWSSDGTLAIADWESDILLLDPEDGERRTRIQQPEPTEVHFDPRCDRLAATAQDGFLRVWDARSRELAWKEPIPIEKRGWPGNLFGASWSPDGRELVASTFDGRIQVRDAATGALLREAHRSGMIFTQFCADGQHILASAYAGNQGMELLDAKTLTPTWTSKQTNHLWPVLSSACERVFSANWLGYLGVWDARTGRLVAEIGGLPPGNPRLGVSPDGTCVVLAAGKYISFFDSRAER